jgi:hypothetical protein
MQRWTREVISPERAKEILESDRMCAWSGCMNSCKGDLPPDWVNLLTWWSPQPTMRDVHEIVFSGFCTRDAVLCGEHARELEALLVPLGPDPRLEDPAGEA